MKQVLLFLCVVIAAVSCKDDDVLLEDEKQGIVKEVRQTLDSYYADIRNNGLMAEFKYLDSSADFFWVPPGFTNAITYDAVVSVISQNAPLLKRVDNSWDTLTIKPIDEDIATYTGRMRSVITAINDSVAIYKMMETGVMIKRSNGWKILSGQTNVIPAN
jgi:regulator of extracellular matrix RemA (YlzA/DUF370 family)